MWSAEFTDTKFTFSMMIYTAEHPAHNSAVGWVEVRNPTCDRNAKCWGSPDVTPTYRALAGQRLAEDGVDVINGVYTFSSPRLGDKVFRDYYRVLLFRFELANDLVPHFPLPPSLTKLTGRFNLNKFVGRYVARNFDRSEDKMMEKTVSQALTAVDQAILGQLANRTYYR